MTADIKVSFTIPQLHIGRLIETFVSNFNITLISNGITKTVTANLVFDIITKTIVWDLKYKRL